MIITIQEIMRQHSEVVENVLESHFLWCPCILDVVPLASLSSRRTVLRLNDGRECEVVTRLNREDGEDKRTLKIETEVGKWEMKKKV